MDFTHDVIVVGAGPVGDTLALLLGQLGLKTLIADKAADIYPLPRAAHIDHETVRVFQQLGVAEEVMAACRPSSQYDFLTADRQVLMRFLLEGSPSGWPAANMIHQPSIEETLRRRMKDFASIDLRVRWELTNYESDEEGVVACFSTPEGDEAVRARFLIGCDGASSRVRALSGAKINDLKFDEPWLVIDTQVLDASRLPPVNLQICDPQRPTTCVLMGAGRHRWEFMLRSDETAEQALDDAFIADLLSPWNVDGAVVLERKAVYRFHALIAEEWRFGRVFLAGDAAHQTPPFAGQGMCSGIRDAVNLAWKIAAVLHDDAGDHILDSYSDERIPHVRSVIDLALMMGRTVCIQDLDEAAARDAAMLAQRAAMGEERPGEGFAFPAVQSAIIFKGSPAAGELFPQPWSGAMRWDDVAGEGAWLITTESAAPVEGVAVFALEDEALSPFAPAFSQWLENRGVASVLVRPDRYVFGTGSANELASAWHRALDGSAKTGKSLATSGV